MHLSKTHFSEFCLKFKQAFFANPAAVLSTKFLFIVLANSLTFHNLHYGDDLSDFAERFMKNFFWNFGNFFILLSLLSLLKAKAFQMLVNALFWASFIIAFINIFLLINFNFTLNAFAISTFFATNVRESGEFLDLYLYDNASTLLILGLFVLFSVWVFFAKRARFVLAFSRKFHLVLAAIIAFFVWDNYSRYGVLHQMQKSALFYALGGVYLEVKEQENLHAEFENLKAKMNEILAAKLENTGGGGIISALKSSFQKSSSSLANPPSEII